MRKPRVGHRSILWVEELESRLVPSTVYSTNWSGYAALPNSPSSTFSAVSGSWTVPTVQNTSGTGYTSIWVGLDGYNSGTVEQIGTDSDIVNGRISYYAWYETYPNPSYNVPTSFAVNPGDAITASVAYQSNTTVTTTGRHPTTTTYENFSLTITDTPAGGGSIEHYSTNQQIAGAQLSSAEWIVEAPSSNQGVLPLSNFGTVSFTNAQATLTGTSTPGPILSSSWQNTAIDMETSRGVPEATVTVPVSAATPSIFTVTYEGTTKPTPPPPAPHQHHGWGWYSNNSTAPEVGSLAMAEMSATQVSATFAPAQQAAANFSTVAPPVAAPSGLWMSLTGPAASSTDGGDADGMMDGGGAMSRPFGDLVHPAALAMATALPLAAVDATPPQGVVEQIRNNAALVAEAPATSSAPPASQPEPQGNLVTKVMSKAFWIVSALAFVSHTAFMRGKRQTGRDQKDNEHEGS